MAVAATRGLRRTRRVGDRLGDRAFRALAAAAAAASVLVIAAIVWKVVDGSWPALRHYGVAFVWHEEWNPVTSVFGARDFLIGTLVTSFGAILLAAPVSIAIALFLSELAPPWIREPVGALVDMLAAVPSVVVGLWGIYVLSPFVYHHLEPFLHRTAGWIPIFGTPSPAGVFPALLVLAIMATPIISSVCRELFASVPKDVQEAAFGLGATRWEVVCGVVLPHVRGGVLAAITLGLGRALGEAIAVTQVIGNGTPLHADLFGTGATLASELANQYSSALSELHVGSLISLALILLVITFIANLAGRRIVHRSP